MEDLLGLFGKTFGWVQILRLWVCALATAISRKLSKARMCPAGPYSFNGPDQTKRSYKDACNDTNNPPGRKQGTSYGSGGAIVVFVQLFQVSFFGVLVHRSDLLNPPQPFALANS